VRGRFHVLLALCSVGIALAGCVAAVPSDSHEVEGVLVANEGTACSLAVDPCKGALDALLEREPGASVVSAAIHDAPAIGPDGSRLLRTTQVVAIVLTLADGSERIEAFGCSIGSWFAYGDHVPETLARRFCAAEVPTPPPTEELLDGSGAGAMRWTATLPAGRYGFMWRAMAGDTGCDARLVLDGPRGTTRIDGRHLDPHTESGTHDTTILPSPSAGAIVLVDTTTASAAPPSGWTLEAGTYTLRLDTDCPGPSHLWAWRYLG
jgi:hypothetical protein